MTWIKDEDIELEDAEKEINYLRRASKIPETRYEFAQAFAQLLNKPVGYILGRTKGVHEKHFRDAYSDIKNDKDKESKVKRLMWWLKNLQTREVGGSGTSSEESSPV